MPDPSIREYFVARLGSLIGEIPEIEARVEVEQDGEDGMDVRVALPKAEEEGFDIGIQVFDRWEINLFAGECSVDFFLSAKEKHAQHNRRRVDEAIELFLGLLGPSYRVRQWYRGGLLLRGRVERLEGHRWVVRAWYRRCQWLRELFATRSHRVLQNHHIEIGAS